MAGNAPLAGPDDSTLIDLATSKLSDELGVPPNELPESFDLSDSLDNLPLAQQLLKGLKLAPKFDGKLAAKLSKAKNVAGVVSAIRDTLAGK